MAFISLMLIILLLLFRTGSFAELDSITPRQSMSDNGTTLVSKEGSFELGFFSPGSSSNNRYVGIWYKNIPVQTVVWVANRCNPIYGSSGMLTINNKGSLVILDRNKNVVWETTVSKQATKPKVELLDSGNLVITEEEDTNSDKYLWQSFDYPSDTFLPGMKLGWDLRTGLNRQLSAWKNWDDPCSGEFTWGIEFNLELRKFPEAVIRKGTAKFHRSGPWNGLGFSGVPDKPHPLFDFVFINNDDEVCYTYNLKNMSLISRIVMNETTSTRGRLIWIESEQIWKTYSSTLMDSCDRYGICGANGNCVITTTPICQCLNGFRPKSQEQWNATDWSQGCVRNNSLICQMDNKEDVFMKLSGLKLPDTTSSWVNKDMNLEECKARCLSNCFCTAYSSLDIRGGGSGCIIWFDELMDVRQSQGGTQDLYLRMPGDSILGRFVIKYTFKFNSYK